MEIPIDLIQRIRQRIAPGQSAADVIRAALDALDQFDQERAAIQVGIDAMHAGEMEDWEDFDRRFRDDNGIERHLR